jgi:hypothetical protein
MPSWRAAHPSFSGHNTQAGLRGAEIHQGLGEIASACVGDQFGGEHAQRGLGLRQRRGHGEQPRHHALDVAVHGGGLAVEGDGGNGARRIGADAGQRAQSFLGIGEAAAMVAHDGLGTFVQVARAGVIAEPGPGGEQILDR